MIYARKSAAELQLNSQSHLGARKNWTVLDQSTFISEALVDGTPDTENNLLASMLKVSENFAVVGETSILVQRNQTATLPCWLRPPQSAENLEVRWYRGSENFDNTVMTHKAKSGSQSASYVGRVSFGLKDAASGGLKAGDVSLKLVNVTIQDAGVYTCFVSSSEDYGSSTVALSVTETGSPPLLTAVWKEANMVEVSCESEGWYPQPELLWSHKNKALTSSNVKYDRDSTGLYSVHSWVLVSSSSEISCSVGVANQVTREVRIKLTNHQRSLREASEPSSDGWVAFGILVVVVVVVLAAAGAVYFRKRFKKSESGGDQPDGQKLSEEAEALLPIGRVVPTALLEPSKHYVNVELMDTKNPHLTIRGSRVRDAKVFPDGDTRVTCLTAIRGTCGFSTGQHYWEVSLKDNHCEPKQSWWIGVTNRPEIPQDSSLSPNISNGFWFLSSSGPGDTIQYSTEPETSLHVQSRPETVGVYLDFDTEELSFYNVEEKQLIISLAVKFKGEIFPFFNPGRGDTSVMEIIQKIEQVECNDDV
ncbi:butyrophilin subfamily 2 member A2 isoform X1 [Nothobranchius furzeri]